MCLLTKKCQLLGVPYTPGPFLSHILNTPLAAAAAVSLLILVILMTVGCSYDHPHILAGQGTCGLEIVNQVPDVDAVLVPVGGAGLIAGLALAIKSLSPNVKVYVNDHCFHVLL